MNPKHLNQKRVSQHRKQIKSKLINIFGGKCQLCGYNKCIRSLHFHHLNPEEKEFSLSSNNKIIAFAKIAEEAKKCILVCSNCHGEIEEGIVNVPIDVLNNLVDIKNQLSIEQEKHLFDLSKKETNCLVCNKKIYKPKKCCNVICSSLNRRKTIRPEKEELAELLWKEPTSSIAKKFGVTDKAVEKWAKKFELTKPPRGYWSNRI